jgi:hypothetical protein
MADNKSWTPDTDEALKALIRRTIREMEESDPSVLPHRVRERLKGRVTGDLDVEGYVKEVLAEQRKRN